VFAPAVAAKTFAVVGTGASAVMACDVLSGVIKVVLSEPAVACA
jgi:hypothetical protein